MIKLTEQDIQWYNKTRKYLADKIEYILNETIFFKMESGEVNIYQFITDPKYGFFDLFNAPDSPWQKGFWEWVARKKYGSINGYLTDGDSYYQDGEYTRDYVKATTQMLTGYILEYFEDKSND
jgi:hypothetical protein